MNTNGIHGIVSRPLLERLKVLVDQKPIEELTTYYIQAFEETADSAVHMNTKSVLNKIKDESNIPIFTDETGKAVQAVRSMQQANSDSQLEMDER